MTHGGEVITFGLSAHEVVERLRYAVDEIGRHKHVLAWYLADMEERRLYQVSGHGSTVHFAATQLDMDARRTREYVQVGRSLRELDLLNDALESGELSWSRAVALLPVVQRETQKPWVDFAREHTYRELREEVHHGRPRRPARRGQRLWARSPEGRGRGQARRRGLRDVRARAHALLQGPRAAVE